MQDVWTDVGSIGGTNPERRGYPTQKPVAVLERIVSASSNPGDAVLDPFCGCGTTVHAAQKLGRQWIGIDVTPLAVNLIKRRLTEAFGTEAKFQVIGLPQDLDGARAPFEQDPHAFQLGPSLSSPTRSHGKAASRAPTPASTAKSISAPTRPPANAASSRSRAARTSASP